MNAAIRFLKWVPSKLRPLVCYISAKRIPRFFWVSCVFRFNYKANVVGTLRGLGAITGIFNALILHLWDIVAGSPQSEWHKKHETFCRCLSMRKLLKRFISTKTVVRKLQTPTVLAAFFEWKEDRTESVWQRLRFLNRHLNRQNKLLLASSLPWFSGNAWQRWCKHDGFKLLAEAIKSLVTGRYPTHGGWKVKGVRLRCTSFFLLLLLQDELQQVERCKNSTAFLCTPYAAYVPTCECLNRLGNRCW